MPSASEPCGGEECIHGTCKVFSPFADYCHCDVGYTGPACDTPVEK